MLSLKYRLIVLGCIGSMAASSLCGSAIADCQSSTPTTPITVMDETTSVPNSRQLVNGTGTVVNTGTPGQISVGLPNSGVTAGSYTSANITVNAQGIVTSAATGGGSSGTVTSVTAADGTLTITPTTGAVTAKIPSNVALPGSPTTTTQNPQDNSSNIATTAYVDNAAIAACKRQQWCQPQDNASSALEYFGSFGTNGSLGNAFAQICADGSYALVIPYSTGSGAGSMAQLYHNGFNTTSQIAPLGTFVVCPQQTANVRYWIGFADQYLGNSAIPPSSSNVASFRYSPADGDTTWHFVTNDASGHYQDTDTGITPSTTVNVLLQIQMLSGGGATGSINGTLRASNLTHYPPITNSLSFVAETTNTTSTPTTLDIGKIHCSGG